jgi:glyoxylase-like metal-dependent hydrolase (beta-lactamase superfamily II)
MKTVLDRTRSYKMRKFLNSSLKLIIITSLLSMGNLLADSKGKLYEYETDGNGFNTKNYFFDTGKEVVAFDSQFTDGYAEKSIQYIKSKTKSPIKYLVITHPNPDKFNAIASFKKLGAKVIASKATSNSLKGVYDYKKYYWVKIAKAFTDSNYPKLGKIDITFDEKYDLNLNNGQKISLTELGTKGVSSNQTIAFIPSIQAYIVGDLVHHNAHAWLEGGIVNGKPAPDIKAWIGTLKTLEKLGNSDKSITVFGGRGESSNLVDAVEDQIEYLESADEIVEDYIKGLGAKKSELSDSTKAQAHYGEIQKIFAKKFPNYKLDYMIGYGIYGLVNSKL